MGGHCDYVSMDIPCGCIFDSNFEYEVFNTSFYHSVIIVSIGTPFMKIQ